MARYLTNKIQFSFYFVIMGGIKKIKPCPLCKFLTLENYGCYVIHTYI